MSAAEDYSKKTFEKSKEEAIKKQLEKANLKL